MALPHYTAIPNPLRSSSPGLSSSLPALALPVSGNASLVLFFSDQNSNRLGVRASLDSSEASKSDVDVGGSHNVPQ